MKVIARAIVKFLTNRIFVISVVTIAMFAILIARLFSLQIINGKKFDEDFSLKILREIDIEGQRGLIYDKNGTPLAVNELAYNINYDYSVYVKDRNEMLLRLIRILEKNNENISIEFPIYIDEDKNFSFIDSTKRVKNFKKGIFGDNITEEEYDYSAGEVIEYLKDDFFVLPKITVENKNGQKEKIDFDVYNKMNKQELYDLIKIRYALWQKGFYKYVPQEISVDIKKETMAEILESKSELPGISIVESSVRRYLYPEYTAHILGYTGTISEEKLPEYQKYGYDRNDTVGRIGVEKTLDLYLQPKDGKQVVEVDSLGKTMNVVSEMPSVAGKDVYLSIDLELQKAVQNLIVKQLNNIVAKKLVMKRPSSGETRVPELKDVYKSLFRNGTIDINKIIKSESGSYSNNIFNKFNSYYNGKIKDIITSLEQKDINSNTTLEVYYKYILKTLVSDGILSSTHKESSGYLDFENNNISFYGLLNYYINEEYIKNPKLLKKYNESNEGLSKYEFLIQKVIKADYFNRHLFVIDMYLEMLDKDQFSYKDLSLLLIEQDIVNISENKEELLKKGRLSPLNFMKDIIKEIQLTPNQLALDPSTGGAVVVDVKTGKVLALVSYPSYDNNKISDYKYYQELLNDPTKPLYPTATQGKTAPGSTFKMLSAVAGLEEGVITKDTYVHTTGYFNKISPGVGCWIHERGGSHGTINVRTAIAVSCNYFFNEVGYRLGTNEAGEYDPKYGSSRLAKYATMFGLNTTTGIELTESKPNTPGGDFTKNVNPVTAAMGQELNEYTPTQLARYIATIANGGILNELTLVDRVYDYDGKVYLEKEPTVSKVLDLKPTTLETVINGMIDVTSGSRGTARSFFNRYPVLVGGKTGTAQQNIKRASHAVFTSMAPADNPEIAVVVELPYSYTHGFSSGYIVGTVAKDIYSYYFDLVDEKKSYNYEGQEILD